MFKAMLLIISATGEPQVYSYEDLFMTLQECEAVASASAPAAVVALGGVSGQWACVPAGEMI